MTELSPQAQAVLDAVEDDCIHPSDKHRLAAAALRATADQVVPYEASAPWDEIKCDYDGDHWEMGQWVRAQILAIAAELDGGEQYPYHRRLAGWR